MPSKESSSKPKMKEALKKEIDKRESIEKQMQLMQEEFERFKRKVGVDQMREMLGES